MRIHMFLVNYFSKNGSISGSVKKGQQSKLKVLWTHHMWVNIVNLGESLLL